MANEVLGLDDILAKDLQDFFEVMPFFQGTLGRDAVYFFRIERDRKTLGADDVVFVGKELSPSVMQLPCQLNQPWPVVQVRHGRVVRPG